MNIRKVGQDDKIGSNDKSCGVASLNCVMVYNSGSQTFLKKLRNGPLAIFLMAHGPLEKLTQNNTLIFYCINVTRALASLQTYSRKMNNLLELD